MKIWFCSILSFARQTAFSRISSGESQSIAKPRKKSRRKVRGENIRSMCFHGFKMKQFFYPNKKERKKTFTDSQHEERKRKKKKKTQEHNNWCMRLRQYYRENETRLCFIICRSTRSLPMFSIYPHTHVHHMKNDAYKANIERSV